MKKAKILYLITQSQWGGAQRYVFDLAYNFSSEFEVVVAFGGAGELKERLEEKGVRCITLKNLVREIHPWKDWLGFWEIYNLIRKERPDILHTNSSKAEILGNIAGWLAGVKKIIFTAHGFVFNEDIDKGKKMVYILWEKLASLFVDRIICVSEFDRQTGIFHGIANPKKMTVIHNGIAQEKFFERPKKDSNRIVIGTVANFYRNKALECFIAAADMLNRRYANLEFQILGDGEERKFLEGEIARQQLFNFRLVGARKDPRPFLQELDIFVLSSTKEGFPYAVLEAMSAGLPIVSTEVGGVPEAVAEGKNGFLVRPKDAAGLAGKIEVLIENSEMRKMLGRSSWDRVGGEFSLQEMLEKTKQVMRQR